MSYRDMQVLAALKMLRATGVVIDDFEMSTLTGLKRQDLWSTYRNLKKQDLIEYIPAIKAKKQECWIRITETGHQTAQEALQAALANKTVNITTKQSKDLIRAV